jgi:excisionase family DNA binding protein
MPYRTFNLEEAASYLNLDVSELKQLVKNGEIPFEKRGDKIVFKRSEIDDWASRRILEMPDGKLAKYHQTSTEKVKRMLDKEALMPSLLKKEYINPALAGKTKASVIREMAKFVDQLGLVSDVNELINELIAREDLCSTGLPGGIAILHTRSRHPYMFTESFLAVGKSIQKIYFGAPDGEPTDIFFLSCCKEDQLHLHTLARVCMLARENEFLESLRQAEDADQIYDLIVETEKIVLSRKYGK